MPEGNSYWYLASYPKSGNTWCRVFIAELMRLSGDKSWEELNLNQDIETGEIASSRRWLDDQLGVNSCDLSFSELDPLRGRAGASAWLFAEGERFHKVHDAFNPLIPVVVRWSALLVAAVLFISSATQNMWPYHSAITSHGRWKVVWIICSIPVQL